MPDDMLGAHEAWAERSDPEVRAAALMRLARVLTASEPARARSLFERGLEAARGLTPPDRDYLLGAARLLAAAVAPDLLPAIPRDTGTPSHFESEKIGRVMLEHEHGDAAYNYLMTYDNPSTFPFGLVSSLLDWFGDEARRLAVLRRAVENWRASPDGGFGRRPVSLFVSLFQGRWKTLPPEEARDVAREIVRSTLARPDTPISAGVGDEDGVRFTSTRQHTLFLILHVLRSLDPPLAVSLIAQHEQLAAAARRFPNGMETFYEAERRRSASPLPAGRGFGMAGDPKDFPYMMTLMEASDDGDFGPSIEHAIEKYREDSDAASSNRAPREFWPSTCCFREILFQAGQRLGRDASALLDRVPDSDLRLFAHIEFEAALTGLPELRGMQMEQRSPLARQNRTL